MRALIAALAMAGLVVSVLALRVHNMDPGAEPPCVVNAQWDCGTVNHSKYAVFPPLKFEEAPGQGAYPSGGDWHCRVCADGAGGGVRSLVDHAAAR